MSSVVPLTVSSVVPLTVSSVVPLTASSVIPLIVSSVVPLIALSVIPLTLLIDFLATSPQVKSNDDQILPWQIRLSIVANILISLLILHNTQQINV